MSKQQSSTQVYITTITFNSAAPNVLEFVVNLNGFYHLRLTFLPLPKKTYTFRFLGSFETPTGSHTGAIEEEGNRHEL